MNRQGHRRGCWGSLLCFSPRTYQLIKDQNSQLRILLMSVYHKAPRFRVVIDVIHSCFNKLMDNSSTNNQRIQMANNSLHPLEINHRAPRARVFFHSSFNKLIDYSDSINKKIQIAKNSNSLQPLTINHKAPHIRVVIHSSFNSLHPIAINHPVPHTRMIIHCSFNKLRDNSASIKKMIQIANNSLQGQARKDLILIIS